MHKPVCWECVLMLIYINRRPDKIRRECRGITAPVQTVAARINVAFKRLTGEIQNKTAYNTVRLLNRGPFYNLLTEELL